MTCIAGLVDDGTIYLGADSAGVAGYDISRRIDSKVFINNGFIIGFTSSFRMGQLLRYKFTPPAKKENQDLYEYMVTDFIEEVRSCLKNGGYTYIENNEETGGCFIVGHQGRLFVIESDFQVGEYLQPYVAVGCGGPYALASLYSTEYFKDKIFAEDRIKLALESAEEFNAGVRGPFNILKLEE